MVGRQSTSQTKRADTFALNHLRFALPSGSSHRVYLAAVLGKHGVHAQALDGLAVDEMTIHDFVHVGHPHALVPDGLGVHHDTHARFTGIQAAALLRANLGLELHLIHEILEALQHLLGAARFA